MEMDAPGGPIPWECGCGCGCARGERERKRQLSNFPVGSRERRTDTELVVDLSLPVTD